MSDPCFFIAEPRPKIAIVYIYPLNGFQGFSMKALEFAQSYQRNPPGLKHETIIVANGEPITQSSKDLFEPLQNKVYIDHDNSGWDIGGFQAAARHPVSEGAEMMVFFGAQTYFRNSGWLARMHEVFMELGDTLYGSSGNKGDERFGVFPHVRTTAFWCSRALFNGYPHQVKECGAGLDGERYRMEHGRDCFTSWVIRQGRQPWIVGRDCVFPIQQCDSLPGGYHNGDQHNLLVGDRMTCPGYYHTP
mgnify:CR=1 FL=1